MRAHLGERGRRVQVRHGDREFIHHRTLTGAERLDTRSQEAVDDRLNARCVHVDASGRHSHVDASEARREAVEVREQPDHCDAEPPARPVLMFDA